MNKTEVLVVGGGPGGLACATLLAQHGVRVVLVERKPVVGPKVCAGGITCNGLLCHMPAKLLEREFFHQHVFTPRQSAVITGKEPVVATVNRRRLGQWMSAEALNAGVILLTGTRLT
ncbi:MAG: NAD(P)-binding protein, partial [Desulfobulbus sp.]|nr:NAD(P)-binding protein [Desulfobulbus sp.]